jgi:cytochrome c oxidase assembly protein subunit 17
VGIKSGKKICCCCPETKQARDACVLANGEDDEECKRLIELHKECLRGEGFDVK